MTLRHLMLAAVCLLPGIAGAAAITTGAGWEQSFDRLTWVPAAVCADDAAYLCPSVPAPAPGDDAFAYFRTGFTAAGVTGFPTVSWSAIDSNITIALNGTAIADIVNGQQTSSGGRFVPVTLFGPDNMLTVALSPRAGSLATRFSTSLDFREPARLPEPATAVLLLAAIGFVASNLRSQR